MNNTCCIILAAGDGKRMKSDKPKVLSEVLFEPMLKWVINAAHSCGISEICTIIGFKHELVLDFLQTLEQKSETRIQKERNGTAHAVMTAKDFLKSRSGGDVLILSGDSPFINKETIIKAYKAHITCVNEATILSSVMDNPFGYGRIVRDANYSLQEIVEEKDANSYQKYITEINSGAYWFKIDTLLSCLETVMKEKCHSEYYLTSVVKLLFQQKRRIDVFEASSPDVALGANDCAQLQVLNAIARDKNIKHHLENGVNIPFKDGVIIGNEVTIEPGTSILPNTIIIGKTVVGKHCVIGPNCYIKDRIIEDLSIIEEDLAGVTSRREEPRE